jgi:RNase P subunit RPR2
VRVRSEGQTRYLVITCLACGFRQKLVWQPRKPKSLPSPNQKSGRNRERS